MTERVLVGSGGPADEVVKYVAGFNFYAEWSDWNVSAGDLFDDASGYRETQDAWTHKTTAKKVSEAVEAEHKITNNWFGTGGETLSWFWDVNGNGLGSLPRYGHAIPDTYLLRGTRVLHDDIPDSGVIGACYLEGVLVVATDAAFYSWDAEEDEWVSILEPEIFDTFATAMNGDRRPPVLFSPDGSKAVCCYLCQYSTYGEEGNRYRSTFELSKNEEGEIEIVESRDDVDYSGVAAWTSVAENVRDGMTSELFFHCGAYFPYTSSGSFTSNITESIGEEVVPIVFASDYDSDGVLVNIEYEYTIHSIDEEMNYTLDTTIEGISCEEGYTLEYATASTRQQDDHKEAVIRITSGGVEMASIVAASYDKTLTEECAYDDHEKPLPQVIEGSLSGNAIIDNVRFIITSLDARVYQIAGLKVEYSTSETWDATQDGGSTNYTYDWTVTFQVINDGGTKTTAVGSGTTDNNISMGDDVYCPAAGYSGYSETDGDDYWFLAVYFLESIADQCISNNNGDILIGLVDDYLAEIVAATHSNTFPENPSGFILHGLWSARQQEMIYCTDIQEDNVDGMGWGLYTEADVEANPVPVFRYALVPKQAKAIEEEA